MVQDLVAQYMVKTEGKAADKAATEAEEQVRSMAGMAEMFNVGKNDGDNIIGKFHFSDGMGDLNGKKIPADELFSGLLDAAGSHDSMDDDESEPAVGAISSDTDPASSGEQMQDFNVDVVTSMLDDMGYSPRRSEGDEGPVLVLDPSGTGAADLRVELLCNDFTEVLRPGHHRHVQRQSRFPSRPSTPGTRNTAGAAPTWTRRTRPCCKWT